jgi:hypothetical protein
MATRLGASIVLTLGLLLIPPMPIRAGGPDDAENALGLARLRLRNLAASVRERLDDVDAGAARDEEHRRRLMDQKMAMSRAEVDYQGADFAVKIAEVEATQYEQGTFKHELETIEYNVTIASAELKSAEDRFEGSKIHFDEAKALLARIEPLPKTSPMDMMAEYLAKEARDSADSRIMAAKFGLDKAKFVLEQANTSKEVLVNFTKMKRTNELRAEVEKARSNALEKKAEIELAKSAQARLEGLIAKDHIDSRALTDAEKSALDKFAALHPAWKAIVAGRDDLKADAAKRDEAKRRLDDFAKALDEADRAWSAAREARLDDRDADLMRRADGFVPKPLKLFGGTRR